MKSHRVTTFSSLALLLLAMASGACTAQTEVDDVMGALAWHHRVLLLFAPSREQANYLEQLEILGSDTEGLRERNIVVWLIVADQSPSLNGTIQSDLSSNAFRSRYRVPASDYAVVLVGKDGGVKLRQNAPVSLNELFELIDAMPMRQEEMRKQQQFRSI